MSGIFGGARKATDQVASPTPQVTAQPASPDAAALRRAGRASLLLNSSPQGVLGQAKTGRAQLLSAV